MEFSIKETNEKIKNESEEIIVKGWVRSVRKSTPIFVVINDGSTPENIQLVFDPNIINSENSSKIKVGNFLKIKGNVVTTLDLEQNFEILVNEIITHNDNFDSNCIVTKNKINLDTLRDYCHLRPRTQVFGSIFRIRSELNKLTHEFMHNNSFLHLDPNIITVNECEGGAGVFTVTELLDEKNEINKIPSNSVTTEDLDTDGNKIKKKIINYKKDHFKKKVFLTVSSQLQLEPLACALGNVYTVNKSFRSEHSNTNKHVSEFTHFEIEMVDNTMEELMKMGENYIKFVIQSILNTHDKDLCLLTQKLKILQGQKNDLINDLNNIANTDFKRLRFKDAIEYLKTIEDELDPKPIDNEDLSHQMETKLVEKFGPIFITHWPNHLKSFYMRVDDDEPDTCQSFDLLLPKVGELIGGSQREERYEILKQKMEDKNIDPNSLQFYLDIRKYGTVIHGGFGLGMDRLLMLLTGINNIKDVIPYPVYYQNCQY